MLNFQTFDADPDQYKAWQNTMTRDRYEQMIGDFYKAQREILRDEIDHFFSVARTRNIRSEVVELTKQTQFELIDIYTLQLNVCYLLPLYREIVFHEDLGLDHDAIKAEIMENHCIPEWEKANDELQKKTKELSELKLSSKESNFLEKYCNNKQIEKFWFDVVLPKIQEITNTKETKTEESKSEESKDNISLIVTNKHIAAIREATMRKNLIEKNDHLQASLITEKDSLVFRIDDEINTNKDLQHYYEIKSRSNKKIDFYSIKFLSDLITPSTRLLWDFMTEKIISGKEGSDIIYINAKEYLDRLGIKNKHFGKAQLLSDLHTLSCGWASFYDSDGQKTSSQVLSYLIHNKNDRNNMEYKGKVGAEAAIKYIKITFGDWIQVVHRFKKQYIRISEKHYQLNIQKYPHSSDLSWRLHVLYRFNDKRLSITDSWHSIKLDTLLQQIDVTNGEINHRGKEYFKNKIRDTLSYLEAEQIFEIKHIDKETIEYRPVNYEQALIDKPKKSSKKKPKTNSKSSSTLG